MEWLSSTDYPAQQHSIMSQKQGGTAQWFVDSPAFKRWRSGAEKTLFCPGMPGAGKTMMAAVAIDFLSKSLLADSVGLAYLFCSYDARADQTATSLLTALLKQLVQRRPEIADPVKQVYEDYLDKSSKPSLAEIVKLTRFICERYRTVFIVVDALDECTEKNCVRVSLVDALRDLQTSFDVRLLFTSRFIPEIEKQFESDLHLEIRASEGDVRRFVAAQMPNMPACIRNNEDLKLEVQERIVQAVGGMQVSPPTL